MGDCDVIRDCDFHPDEPHVRVFSYNRSSILRWDDHVFVSEALFNDVVLRHYAFQDEWFKINVTTDRSGQIIETPSTADAPAFAFNCDITTPMVQDHNTINAVDLYADVLVRDDGVAFEIADPEEFDAAPSNGSISADEHRHAIEGLARLVELIRGNQLIPFLIKAYPFGHSNAQPALPMTLVPLTDVPLPQPGRRSTW